MINPPTCFEFAKRLRESQGNIYDETLVIIGERKHTFPSRTRSLSSQPPMVVRPRCRARVGCCQSNEAQVSKEACASLVFHVRTQKFLCEAQKAFGKHNWRMPITRRARTARIGVSQPKQTRAKDVRLLLFTGVRALWIGHEVENFQGEHRFRHKTTSNT